MNPLDVLIDPLRALLDIIHEQGNLTYGWSIVVLTVLVRVVMIPLVVKQYTSMRRLQALAPQIKELQEKYKGDRKRLNEEVMRFYRENNVNPASSCLPLLVQLPVFISLFYVLRDFSRGAVEGDAAVDTLSFMWVIPDITLKLTEIGLGAVIIVMLYAASQLLVTELSLTPTTPQAQKRLMRLLPLVIVVFVFQFPVPSGLVIYWVATNLWSAGQQMIIKDRLGPAPTAAELKNVTGGTGSRTPSKDQLTVTNGDASPTEAATDADEAGVDAAVQASGDSSPAEQAPANGGDATPSKKQSHAERRRQTPRRKGKRKGAKRRSPRRR
ncbi:MAG: YidC/Oxa1 family membrane protein insertase [Thermoleophilia bacterium]|nr:YidC/Oxa1 family membrane protein insertase [Thermoleophilia bacterium]